MKWLSFIHHGNRYHLSHLYPFDWHYTTRASGKRPACVYKFQVKFSMHCFTRGPMKDEEAPEEFWYEGPDERRIFCFERYALSFQLPAIIRSMGDRNCYHTPNGNFFTIELTTREGKRVEYEVYFNVSRSSRKGWLNLYVESAYARTRGIQPKKRKIGLDVIAHSKQTGRKIRTYR